MQKLILIIFLSLMSFQLLQASVAQNNSNLPGNIQFCVISDPHYHDASLGVSGVAFEKYLMADRKMLAESESILKSAIQIILQQKPKFVLIPGDLTKDGEKVNHEKFESYLAQIESNGIQVYVIPGNHDVLNGHAFQFEDSTVTPVPSVTPEEFATIYANYGYSEAIARDPNSLSYIAEPAEGMWLFALDPCLYRENSEEKPETTGGKYSEETLQWVEDQLDEAKKNNILAIGMMHHGILEHYLGQKTFFSEYVVDDYTVVAERFASLGLQLMFTGHYHAQDITMQNFAGNARMFDVETGSLVTYPSPIRTVEISPDLDVHISTQNVETIDYDTKGASFPEYAKSYLLQGLNVIAMYTLTLPKEMGGYGLPEDQATMVAPLVVDAFAAHYSGDEIPSAEVLATITGFITSDDPNLLLMGQFLGTFWTDLKPWDNQTEFNLQNNTAVLNSKKVVANWNGVNIYNGGFGSSMALDPNNTDYFYMLTDRGPNVNGTVSSNKVFPCPEFAPMIGKFHLENDSLILVSIIELKDKNGNKLSGLVNLKGEGGTGETGIDLNGVELPNDSLGIDPEGLVSLSDGSFWIADEYGPHIIHFDSEGKTIERLNPFISSDRSLPKVLARRRANRGMEGLTITPNGNTLVGLMQSPLYNPAKDSVKTSLVTRILTFDIETGIQHEYVYLLENTSCANSEIVAITDTTFLVIERDMNFLYGNPTGKYKFIYKINIGQATDIHDTQNSDSGLLFNGKTIEELGELTQLTEFGIVPVTKELIVNLIDLGYVQDKPEGLVILNPNLIAVCNDDDFGILGDGNNGIVPKWVPTQNPAMNFVDHNVVTFVNLSTPLYTPVTGITQPVKASAKDFSLQQNYPNPFNPVTTISYQIKQNSHVTLKVYDILGQEVVVLVDKNQNSGLHKVQFNASHLATGFYFYELKTTDNQMVRKMLLLK